VPNQPKTPIKSFRIPVDLYDAALAKAQSEGRTLTAVVREALQRYIDAD
jgi:predicted DNA-binding protein